MPRNVFDSLRLVTMETGARPTLRLTNLRYAFYHDDYPTVSAEQVKA